MATVFKEWDMGFFSDNSPTRNVLVLGDEASGKRSFLLYYKDNLWAQKTGVFSTLSVIDQDEGMTIVFDLNDPVDDKIIPTLRSSRSRYDLILIIGNLASTDFNRDCKAGLEYADRAFPGVNRMIIGTKADEKLPGNNSDNTAFETSAKTGQGFNNFRRVFLHKLKMVSDVSEPHHPFPTGN